MAVWMRGFTPPAAEAIMKPVLVIYATREGQTRYIAEHLAATLGAKQHPCRLVDAARIPKGFSMAEFSAAIACASLHMGKYEPEMAKFVKRYQADLRNIPTAFLSVSLAEASAQDADATPEYRAEAQAHVEKTIAAFLAETGWTPSRVSAAAGALMYSKYNFITRFVMKRIARKAGRPTDASRDYEYTDWNRLDRLADEFAASARLAPPSMGGRTDLKSVPTGVRV
jgi:menaquinone-dependent protoporphyrinogen oxidase